MDTIEQTSYYKFWYEANKERLSKKRKEKYHSDAALRAKAIERQRRYRAEHVRPSTKGSAQYRHIDGELVRVYRIASAADRIGCSPEFIRKYEQRGIIPPPIVDSAQRYYTAEQIKLLRTFYQLMMELKYEKDPGVRELALIEQAENMVRDW